MLPAALMRLSYHAIIIVPGSLRAEQVSYRFHWKKHPCAGRQLYKLVFPVEFAGLLIDRVCVRASLSCFPGAGGFNIVSIKIFLSSTD